MFPLQRGNELVIQFSSSPHHHQHQISEDLILDHYVSLDVSDSDKKLGKSRSKKLSHDSDKINHSNSNEHRKKKKMIHREIERQRRKEMATLYASLRSFLPFDFIRGKRSISDHMNEAVNYIKHLQKNIKELGAKRDELKKLSNPNNQVNPESQSSPSFFTVHEINGMVGIEITSGFRKEKFPLSKFLELLLQEGFEVLNCLSTQVNGKLLHSVQCGVNNSNSVDLPELRRKVANVIPSFRCSD